MATSQARLDANRRNAQLSTGPRSPEGKDRSRANSLKHGLTARVLRTEEEVEALGEPTTAPPGRLGSSPLDAGWIEGEIQLIALRIERAGRMEAKLRERAALRAIKCWDLDRCSEAARVGLKLRKNPAEVVANLEKTPQGCRWLIQRWAMLARMADRDGAWSDSAQEMAFDLQGTPEGQRSGRVSERIDFLGEVTDPGRNLADFARQNVCRLIDLKRKLAGGDKFDRATAVGGLQPDLGDAGRRLARYEASLQGRLRWYHGLIEAMADPASPPLGHTPPVPAPPAEADEGTEADEPTSIEAPVAGSIPSRQDRRAERVERRRLACDRKLARRLG